MQDSDSLDILFQCFSVSVCGLHELNFVSRPTLQNVACGTIDLQRGAADLKVLELLSC